MANFSATDVKKLRDTTGAGMMDAKKALDEADGNFDAAIDILRTKGAAKAAKRGAELIQAAQKIADAASEAKPADVEALQKVQVGDETVEEIVEALAVSIGEKIEIGQYVHFDGPVVAYLHKRAADLPPAIGVLVEYDGDADAARGAAKQVAAMRPQYLTRDDVPAEIVEHERQIAEATSREEGKPEQAIAKITEGRLNGFFKEVVLLEQPSVTENKKTVQSVLDESGTTVKRFARFEVGA
jgi:elongation factor Ts